MRLMQGLVDRRRCLPRIGMSPLAQGGLSASISWTEALRAACGVG
jgi:hypothetical protein